MSRFATDEGVGEDAEVKRSNKKRKIDGPLKRTHSEKIPEPEELDLMCCITQELLEDPVVTCDGHTYSRMAIEKWLLTHNTSPVSGETLENKTVTPNLFVRKRVQGYKRKLGFKLIELIERKEIERAMEMISDGKADLNVRQESDRKTPLLVGCQRKEELVVKVLLENGAELDAKDVNGKGGKDFLPNFVNFVNWKKIKALVGKEETDKLKQGPAFDGELNLRRNNLGDGAKALTPALAKMTGLKGLDLRGNNLGPDGARALAPALAKMTGLKELWLRGNNLGPDGAKILAPYLAEMKGLKKLGLRFNNLGPDGAKALTPALAKMTGLKGLDLRGNNLGPDGARALTPALAKMRISCLTTMHYCKRTNLYCASNVTFNPKTKSALSYGWWEFVKEIDGKLIYNDYFYSNPTAKQKCKVLGLLAILGLEIDIVIKAPGGLQRLDLAIAYYKEQILSLEELIAKPRTHKHKNEERRKLIYGYKGTIKTIEELIK
jgi:hypothetical protein